MTEQEIRAAHPDWTDEQVAAEVAKLADPDPQVTEEATVSMTKAEVDALRRRVAESEKATRKLEADRKKEEEARQAEDGKWQELAQQRERELAQERADRERVQNEARITRLATRLKFVDPADVIGRVSSEDAADDTLAEAALERIAQQSPHLVAKDAPALPEIGQVLAPSSHGVAGDGAPKPPPGKAPLKTIEDVDALSQQEMVDRMDEIDWVEGRRSKK